MYKMLYNVIFASLAASIIFLLVCDHWDALLNPGILCWDVLLLMILFSTQRSIKQNILLSVVCIIVMIVSLTIDMSIYGAFYLILIWLSYFLKKSRTARNVLCSIVLLFTLIAGWCLFFESAFSMSIGDLWGISKFFWWGVLLFIAVPIVHFGFVYFFGYKIINSEVLPKHNFSKAVFVLILSFLGIHFLFAKFQNRQPILDFPIYEFVKLQLQPGHFSQSSILQEDIKNHYKILNQQDLSLELLQQPTVMILVESWGVRKDYQLNDNEFEVFFDNTVKIKGIWKRFASFTQAAEYEDFKMNLNVATLVDSFKKSGYETWYVHGYDGNFYDRKKNYDALGFDHIKFKEDFLKDSLVHCHYGNVGFEGICDSSLVSYVDELLSDSIPKFVYWTTLDSHPPYETQIVPQEEMCRNLSNIACVHAVRIRNTLKFIASLAKKHPEYRFVLRGDHRPMGAMTDRSFIATFYNFWVPVIILN